MEECQRCKQLELLLKEQAEMILKLQTRIEELEKKLKLRSDDEDDDHSDCLGNSDYLQKLKKKPGKQFGKNKKKKKRGAKKGHKGHGRQKCDLVDQEVELTLERCPDCSEMLIEKDRSDEFVQEDLVIKKVTTKYKVRHYECPCCNKEVTPVFESGFIGSTAKSLSTLLHYYSGVPFNKIREMFSWFGLNVSEGSLALWGKRFSEKLENSYNTLKSAVKKSSYVNVDETGWPIDGKNNWLWVFRSSDAVVYKIDASRGSSVVKDFIGSDYEGVLESDFYSAYNPIDCKKQKCLVHLLRAVKDWGDSDNFEKRSFRYGLHRTIDDAKNLVKRKDKMPSEVYDKKVSSFQREFEEYLKNDFSDSDCKRLMKRLRKHSKDLWTFLSEPVPSHNNAAELAIRRAVVNRKVSCGNRSDTGARVQETLLSVIQTAKMHSKNLMESLQKPQMFLLDLA
jgi:transposase